MTTIETIASCPDSMLYKLCNPGGQFSEADGVIEIDRDPQYFRHILLYLRTGRVEISQEITQQGLLAEAEFFQIEPLVRELQSPTLINDLTRRDFLLNASQLLTRGVRGAILREINLSHFNLAGICFDNTYLVGANLSGCKLTKATFNSAELVHASFDGSSLEEAELCGANIESSSFVNCDLSKALFAQALGREAIFTKAKLNLAIFQRAKLEGADFTGASLRSTKFQGADLRGANFSGCDISECFFRGADLRGVTGFDWHSVGENLFDVKITTMQFDALPDEKKQHSFRILPDCNAELSNYFEVNATFAPQEGVLIRDAPGANSRVIGKYSDRTRVLDSNELVEVKRVWYRKVVPLSEDLQPHPPAQQEVRVPGWVVGVYLRRVDPPERV